MHEVFAGTGVRFTARLDDRPARDAQASVRADEVEVVNVVSVAVLVTTRRDSRADVELELKASLPEAVHRPEAYLHDGLGDRARVTVVRAVHNLELHRSSVSAMCPADCCCCWG